MKFVVDTNILFTFFWKDSFTKGLLVDQDLELFSPELALAEVNRHEKDILKKTGISAKTFKLLRKDIGIFVEFIPLDEYKEFLTKAPSLIPDNPDDLDFLALALKLKLPAWPNDPDLKRQSEIKVLSTPELVKLLN